MPKNKNERRIVTIHNETIVMPFSTTVDQYIAISQCVFDAFKKNTGHDNCVICYNGIDVKTFKTKKEYSQKPYKIVALGRILFDVKAQDLIVKADIAMFEAKKAGKNRVTNYSEELSSGTDTLEQFGNGIYCTI